MKKQKPLSAKEFCEIVLDKNRKLPKEINITGRKRKHITKIFGWFETIRNCSHYTQFKIVTRKSRITEKIEDLEMTERELLSLLALWEIYKNSPDKIHYAD